MAYRLMHRPLEGGGAARPAVTGTLNQTGQSDDDASTFDTMDAAEDALVQVQSALNESAVWIEEVTTRAEWLAVAGSNAVEFEHRALSCGIEFLPACARAVRADQDPTPAYWEWLIEQWKQA